jgi:hypothetical protein
MKKLLLASCLIMVFLAGSTQQTAAQNQNSDELSPQTQKYIDNLNEVQQAANNGKAVNGDTASSSIGKGPSVWTFVFSGFLTGTGYAFWRWLKRLKNGD